MFLTLVLVLCAAAYQRNSIWENEYFLWKDVVAKSPDLIIPRINLGNALIKRKAYDLAEQEFRAAGVIDPFDLRVHSGLGIVYFQKKLLDEAIREYIIIVTGRPEFAPAHNNLGVLYMEKGLLTEAMREFSVTTRLDPAFSEAYCNLGLLYKRRGLLDKAESELRKALILNPDDKTAQLALAEVMQLLQGRKISH